MNGVQRIDLVGRQETTSSERSRDEFFFLVMAGKMSLRRSPFIRDLWFPKWKNTHSKPSVVDSKAADDIVKSLKLNESQRAAVHAMVGDASVVIEHGEPFYLSIFICSVLSTHATGPPGTGKTTTIAAASRLWGLHHLPVWVVAHSNVAVKNIAETLSKKEVNLRLMCQMNSMRNGRSIISFEHSCSLSE